MSGRISPRTWFRKRRLCLKALYPIRPPRYRPLPRRRCSLRSWKGAVRSDHRDPGFSQYITDRHAYVNKLTSILKPGGCLVLANTNGIRSLFVTMALCSRVLRFWLKDNASIMRNLAATGIWSGGHVDRARADWLYSADALDALAAKLGLELVRFLRSVDSPGLDRDPRNRTALGTALARRWGWNHVGVTARSRAPRTRGRESTVDACTILAAESSLNCNRMSEVEDATHYHGISQVPPAAALI